MNPPLIRWAEWLSKYRYIVKYIKGKHNTGRLSIKVTWTRKASSSKNLNPKDGELWHHLPDSVLARIIERAIKPTDLSEEIKHRVDNLLTLCLEYGPYMFTCGVPVYTKQTFIQLHS